MSEGPITIELNPRERRLYDRLRERLVPARPGATTGARDVLLFLPDLTVLLGRLLRDRRVPLVDKAVAVAGIAYVLSPIDLLPALVMGPIGLLDDLFVVAACLSRLLNHVHPDVVRSNWSGQGDALEVIQSTTAWFERELRLRVGDLGRVLRGGRGTDPR
ncbi:MAG: YkvA family protein [Myxococcota bacterium]